MSATRIKGAEGVIIDSNYYLELPKAQTKTTTYAERAGMIRYNTAWKAFEGVLDFDDGTVEYRRFANLDSNGQLLTSQLPSYITSGTDYMGTYSPITDDIDPPVVVGQYDILPAPTTDNAGDYFIIRGIFDAAQAHYVANSPATSPVIFTVSNPSSQGNWIEIKYYFSVDPVDTSKKIVVAAFGRINVSAIPSTGHEGLISLSSDSDLTAAFTQVDDRSIETALTDGDWVISTGLKQQRLRNSRVSISAGAVMFDRTISTATNRGFASSTGTVQTILDSLIMSGLRRTGDSMLDDGGKGAGRLGLTYGTATAPAIAFNSNPFDATTNPGNDPTLWSDTTTGIFHPATGSIGFSASAVERLRISPTQIIAYPVASASVTVPNILFSATGNTNLGLLTTNNSLRFVSNGSVNVTFAQGLSTFSGNVVVSGNTQLGDASTDILSVPSSSVFTNTSNTFAGLQMVSGSALTFQGTNAATITKGATSLNINMTAFDDLSVMDGTNLRAKINRYGIQLPVLNPIDDAVGVDGMIAYSSSRSTVMQKTGGKWVVVGSGGGVATTFANADWVLNGSNYTYTITSANILSVTVQELSGSNYSPVEVDTIVISPTNAVLSVPASPDLRFTGRVIVQYQ
jgi:hypothetical protein